MQQKLMRITLIFSTIFVLTATSVILYTASHKVIVIADVAQDEVAGKTENGLENQVIEKNNTLTFVLGQADTSYLCIPLPLNSKAEDVTIENHYMDHELWIKIKSEEGYYQENAISGNRSYIVDGSYEWQGDSTWLKFDLTGIYEYRSILEENNLYIEFLTPSELYDTIVVIDPACGGNNLGNRVEDLQEKEITLQIAKLLKSKLDDTKIKVYYTRMEDTNPSEEDRIALANETRADMYIRIQAAVSEDPKIYGTEAVYNENYFIPGFGSIELADLLEREIVTSEKGKAGGLIAAESTDYAICNATVPAAAVNVGYLSNKQEAILLGREDYLEKIAAGIYNAIISTQ